MSTLLQKNILVLLTLTFFAAQARAHQQFQRSDFAVKIYEEIPGFGLTFKNAESGREVKYDPNLSSLTGLHLSYGGIVSAGYGFRNSINRIDQRHKGDTSYQDFRFSFAFSHFHLALNYQEYKGLYIENSTSVDPSLTEDQLLIKLPDMKVSGGTANFTYIWSPEDFSLVAALEQTVRQEKSGGSLLLGLAVTDMTFTNPSAILPAVVQTDFGVDKGIQEGRFVGITAKVGYGYTLAWTDNFYTSLALQVGGGQQRRKYRDATTMSEAWNVASKSDGLFSTGYNGDTYFGGLWINADITSYKTNSIDIAAGTYAINLYFGAHL